MNFFSRMLSMLLLAGLATNCGIDSSKKKNKDGTDQVVVTDPTSGIEYATGLVRPENWDYGAVFQSFEPKGLMAIPDSYEAPTTSIKNQGSCGSCSHFASTSIYEAALKRKLGKDFDLSEENVLNCAKYDNYQCGGSFFHGRHLQENGAPLESQDPYTARAAACKRIDSASEKPVAWGYVGQQGRTASVDEVRQALVDKGALWITVNASSWGAPGAIKRSCGGGQTNHAVTVVGYRPDPEKAGKYLFKIKNSWGPTWNKTGYVEMALGCDSLGESVAYVELAKDPAPGPGPTPDPTPGPTPCVTPKLGSLPRSVDAVMGQKVGFFVEDDRTEWFEGATKLGSGKTLLFEVKKNSVVTARVSQECAKSEVKTMVRAFEE